MTLSLLIVFSFILCNRLPVRKQSGNTKKKNLFFPELVLVLSNFVIKTEFCCNFCVQSAEQMLQNHIFSNMREEDRCNELQTVYNQPAKASSYL